MADSWQRYGRALAAVGITACTPFATAKDVPEEPTTGAPAESAAAATDAPAPTVTPSLAGHWSGTLDAPTTTSFGSGLCKVSLALQNVTVDLVVGDDGAPTAADVAADVDSSADLLCLAGSTTQHFTYRLETPPDTGPIDLVPSSEDAPALQLVPELGDASPAFALTWDQTDAWTLEVTVPASRD